MIFYGVWLHFLWPREPKQRAESCAELLSGISSTSSDNMHRKHFVLFPLKCCEREAVSVRRSVQPRCRWVSPRSLQLWYRWGCHRSWRKRGTRPAWLVLRFCCRCCFSATLQWWYFYFLTVSLTWECFAVGGVALRTLRHSSVALGDNIYVYGGILGGNPTNDLMVFNTGPYIIIIIIILIKGLYFWFLPSISR